MGSQGILKGIEEEKRKKTQEDKKIRIQEDKNIEIKKKKRSYSLESDTVKHIEELKLYYFPNLDREQIVDEAIRLLYESKKGAE